MDEQLKKALRDAGQRSTHPRVAIYQLLKEHSTPLSIAEINAYAKDVERTSVYRTLQLFKELNIITVVAFGWKQKYELAEPFAPHHHHLHCEVCGAITEIDSDKIERLVEQLSASEQFLVSGHHFEIKGTCRGCSRGTGVVA